jgi:hypothetical protein
MCLRLADRAGEGSCSSACVPLCVTIGDLGNEYVEWCEGTDGPCLAFDLPCVDLLPMSGDAALYAVSRGQPVRDEADEVRWLDSWGLRFLD